MNLLEQMSPENVGERLRVARENAKFTQEDAAKAIDVARTTLVAVEQGQRPAVSVFRRDPDGKIYFTYTTEMSRAPGHHRGIDPFSAVWHLFDLLPEGRENWMPKHFYGPESRSAVISLSAPGPAPDARK